MLDFVFSDLFVIPALIIIFIYFLIFFLVATIIKNNSIVDIGWGLGFVVVAWILFFLGDPSIHTIEKLMINAMVSFWGLRLFYHILKRNAYQEEDFRYKQWRKEWGKWVVLRAFFQIFMLQGLFMYLIGSGVFYINMIEESRDFILWLMIIGFVIWLFGYGFEVIGDRQLKEFIARKNKDKKLMTEGLWAYTRHPNYFGESVLWWGIFVSVISLNAPIAFVVSPIAITLLLRFVSGVPMLEKRMSQRQGWDEYAEKTNAFFPWFPKK
jgi:steroid 5-alpha reductase family enzyme